MADKSKDFNKMATDMAAALQQQWTDTFAGKQESWKELSENARVKYEALRKQAGEGANEAMAKLKKVNDDMLEKMKALQKTAKETMTTEYNKLIKDEEAAAKNLEAYKKQTKDLFQKHVVDKSTNAYKEAMENLDKFQGKSKADFDKFHTDMMKRVDTMQEEAAKKMKWD